MVVSTNPVAKIMRKSNWIMKPQSSGWKFKNIWVATTQIGISFFGCLFSGAFAVCFREDICWTCLGKGFKKDGTCCWRIFCSKPKMSKTSLSLSLSRKKKRGYWIVTHTIHVWYIYLQFPKMQANVGKLLYMDGKWNWRTTRWKKCVTRNSLRMRSSKMQLLKKLPSWTVFDIFVSRAHREMFTISTQL